MASSIEAIGHPQAKQKKKEGKGIKPQLKQHTRS
jgi:hypothetical protein